MNARRRTLYSYNISLMYFFLFINFFSNSRNKKSRVRSLIFTRQIFSFFFKFNTVRAHEIISLGGKKNGFFFNFRKNAFEMLYTNLYVI